MHTRVISAVLALFLSPAVALASWPVDEVIVSPVEESAFIEVERPSPQPWVYLTAVSDVAGYENTAAMSLPVAQQVVDAIGFTIADGDAYIIVVDTRTYVRTYLGEEGGFVIEVGNLDSTKVVPVPMTLESALDIEDAIAAALS